MTNTEHKKNQTIDVNSSKNQAIKRKFVDREVIYNVSSLVYELGKKQECLGGWENEYHNITSIPDYESAVEYNDNYHVMYSNYLAGYVWVNREDHEVSEPFDTEREAYKDCCHENNIDCDYREAYEHWIVSGYLAKKLEDKGEMVDEFFNLTIWGRCTTGQAILLDGVISEICKEMEILEGQRNEWESD